MSLLTIAQAISDECDNITAKTKHTHRPPPLQLAPCKKCLQSNYPIPRESIFSPTAALSAWEVGNQFKSLTMPLSSTLPEFQSLDAAAWISTEKEQQQHQGQQQGGRVCQCAIHGNLKGFYRYAVATAISSPLPTPFFKPAKHRCSDVVRCSSLKQTDALGLGQSSVSPLPPHASTTCCDAKCVRFSEKSPLKGSTWTIKQYPDRVASSPVEVNELSLADLLELESVKQSTGAWNGEMLGLTDNSYKCFSSLPTAAYDSNALSPIDSSDSDSHFATPCSFGQMSEFPDDDDDDDEDYVDDDDDEDDDDDYVDDTDADGDDDDDDDDDFVDDVDDVEDDDGEGGDDNDNDRVRLIRRTLSLEHHHST